MLKYEADLEELKIQLNKLRGCLGEEVQLRVCKYISSIRKILDNDMSGEDLSDLDLRSTPLHGMVFSTYNKAASFEGSLISDNTFLAYGHSNAVLSATYTPDENHILTVSRDNTAIEWDRKSGKCIRTFDKHKGVVNSSMYSFDGQRILSTLSHTAEEWDRKSGQCLRSFIGHLDDVNSAVYSPNDKYVLTASSDCTVKEWERRSGKLLHTFEGHSKGVNSAVYSPDGRCILSVSNGQIIIWDRETLNSLEPRNCSPDTTSARYSPDGTKILSDSASEWEVNALSVYPRRFEDYWRLSAAIYSPNGKRILSTDKKRNEANIYSIYEWDTETSKCMKEMRGHADIVMSIKYSSDGLRALTASSDGSIKEWDRSTGNCIRVYVGHLGGVSNAGYGTDGNLILSACTARTSKVWDSQTGECLHTFDGFSYQPVQPKNKIESPYKSHELSFNLEEIITELIAEILEENQDFLHEFKGYTETVNIAYYDADGQRYLSIFSADEQRALSATDDGIIKEWDSKTGECLWSSPPYGGISVVGCNFKDCTFSSEELKELIRVYGGLV